MIKLTDYRTEGLFLREHGWQIKPSPNTPATAATQQASRTIWVKPKVFDYPNIRVRRYVIVHEIWHALHAEICNYDTARIETGRHLTKIGAIEAVADAGCLMWENSSSMRGWVTASVIWHGRAGRGRYRMADVRSIEVHDILTDIRNHVTAWSKPAV